jgi:2-dehydro-3-deoxygluconokinase
VPRLVTFGEAMLRLSPPGRERLEQARTLELWPAGAELNAAIAAARLGTAAAWVSRLPANPLGRLVAAHARSHGVDVSGITWSGDDRLGLYFTELGGGVRPTRALYDRAGSAFARLDPAAFRWQDLLRGADGLNVSGITPALSPACAEAASDAVSTAAAGGLLVVYDVNLRRRLTTPDEARAALERLVEHIDVVVASASDARALFPELADEADLAPALRELLAVPLVVVSSADGQTHVRAAVREEGAERVERPFVSATEPIGAGDAFCGAFLHALLADRPLREALELADMVAALKLSIPGDAAVIGPGDVEAALAGALGTAVHR